MIFKLPRKNSKYLIAGLLLFSIVGCDKKEKDYTQYVNTFIGTDGTGHTFPGPCLPFGLVQPGPDNRDNGWDYTSGYQYKDKTIMGFSQTRANGTGISEFGDILVMPFIGENKENYAQEYFKESEKSSVGEYQVMLKNGVSVALTATEHVAFHQYIFPIPEANLLLDFQHGLKFITDSLVLESEVLIEDNKTISGYCHTKNWVERKYFFSIQFDLPFISSDELVKQNKKDQAPRYVLKFELPDKLLKVKIALSTVSVAGAKNNLSVELPEWDFKATVKSAKQKWNGYLNRVDIDAEDKQKEIFYSCLYRLLIQPVNIADVDGQYRGANDSVYTAENKEYYSTFSLWDTYRAAHPLYTLLVPEKVDGMMRSMLAHAKAVGILPIWTAWGKENYCMIGNHSIPVLTDAILKGFKGFDADEALQQMIKTTSLNHTNSNWLMLNTYGYYPNDSLSNESVSKTLEHGVDDYAIALLAEKMGNNQVANLYKERANYYKNLYDDSTQFFRGKDSKGNWRNTFDPLTATSPMNNPGDYTEANAWQYFFTPAQYDIEGLSNLLGGQEQFTQKLDAFFTTPSTGNNKFLGQEAMIGQYAHGNEVSHHIAYLYAYTSKPEKGHELVKNIAEKFYSNTPNGMIGNDDCGQMSAWYIFATMGFYPVNAANARFVLNKPLVKSMRILLPNKPEIAISNNGSSNAVEVYLNNQVVNEKWISYEQIVAGGKLEFGR
jgi:predicted alpha-1,2-mannosidase